MAVTNDPDTDSRIYNGAVRHWVKQITKTHGTTTEYAASVMRTVADELEAAGTVETFFKEDIT